MIEININPGRVVFDFITLNDHNYQVLKQSFPDLKFTLRGDLFKVMGETTSIDLLQNRISLLEKELSKNPELSEQEFQLLLSDGEIFIQNKPLNGEDPIVFGPNGLIVKARSFNQKKLVEMSRTSDIVFAIGPAGSGKTYTAVALAVRALKNKEVRKIILTRPAVEAGENLGFLPGDLKEKIDPYLRPLYDALHDMIPAVKLQALIEADTIEIAPLAFMRGRTLDRAFVILDEAQNTTESQLKMFLTRMGPSAKFIVTGDLTQIDLPKYQRSGLIQANHILKNIDGIGWVTFNTEDVVRHKLVKRIIKAYDKISAEEQKPKPQKEA